MIYDLLRQIDFNLQKAVIDSYALKEGLYVKVGKKLEFFLYKAPKRQDRHELFLQDLEGNIRSNEYEWFAIRDYLSNYLNSNKAIDPPKKKIHNNNYLTLFVKEKEFTKENKEYFATKLYDTFKTFASFTKKQEKEVLKGYEAYILDTTRQQKIDTTKAKFLEIYDEILEKKELTNNYIKIFFDEDIDTYKNESSIYFALKIFNKIETIHKIEDTIYGLSDFNMGLNAKKPYLEHKTRGCEYPFLVKKDEIFNIKLLFDYLKYQDNRLTFEGKAKLTKPTLFIAKRSSNDQAEITNFDIIVKKEDTIDIVIKNHTLVKVDGYYVEERLFKSKKELVAYIDEILFNKWLLKSLYNDPYSKLHPVLQNLIFLTRDLIKNYQKGNEKALFTLTKRFGRNFLEYHLRYSSFSTAAMVLNILISLKGLNMNIEEKLQLLETLLQNPTSLQSEDFFVLSGQVIRYLLNHSKASNKTADMFEPFLRVNKANQLKKEIEALFFKYKHEIPLNFQKFNNALALIEAYEGEEKVQKDKLMVGILSENIFYKRGEK